MKFQFDVDGKSHADPFIFEDAGKYYLYVTANEGVEAYSADSPDGIWHYEGVVCKIDGAVQYWAPCIIRIGKIYYLYFSCARPGMFQYLHAAASTSPLGPFGLPCRLFDRFTIDAHVVQTEAGLFLFYAEDNRDVERFGTRVFVDRLIDPFTPAGIRREILVPTMDEEIFARNREGDGRDWHTLEGPFWFFEDGWQYLMYSGGCFLNDSYHIGYAAAKTDEPDLTRVDFIKHTADGKFDPVLFRDDIEEGVGHHSVIRIDGQYYAVYHGRDRIRDERVDSAEARTARICRLHVKDGLITAEKI